MADSGNSEPNEFGAFSGGVSSLRSRFEQMSRSENSLSLVQTAIPSSVTKKPKKLSPPSSDKSLGSNGTSVVAQSLPSRAKPVPVTTRSGAQVETSTLSVSMEKRLSSNSNPSCTTSAGQSSLRNSNHTKSKPDANRLGGAIPTAFGAEPPSLLSLKPRHYDAPEISDHSVNAKPKVPPPKPPKPPKPSELPFKVLNDADLEQLASSSKTKLSSPAHLVSPEILLHTAQDGLNENSSSAKHTHHHHHLLLQPHHPPTDHSTPSDENSSIGIIKHTLSTSSNNNNKEDGDRNGSGNNNNNNQGSKPPRPIVPPRPLKNQPSKDNLLTLPGTIASSSNSDDNTSTHETLSAPPPLPLRGSAPSTSVHVVGQRKRTLTSSKSTSSLPSLGQDSSADKVDAPPLPARRNTVAKSDDTPLLPPPQRVHQPSVPSAQRSVSFTKPKTTPTSRLSPRPSLHSQAALSKDTDFLGPSLPPPARTVSSSHSFRHSLPSSSSNPSGYESDSSSEDDYPESGSAFSPSSATFTPLGMRKPPASSNHLLSSDLPDSSRANRRAPTFNPDRATSARASFQCFAVCGHTVATGSGDKVKVYRVGESATGVGEKLCTVGEANSKDIKLTAIEFRPPNHGVPPVPAYGVRSHGETADEGRYLWCGTKEGHIWQLDIVEARVIYSRSNVHGAPIQLLRRVGNKMLCLDESGKISVWLPVDDPDPAVAGLRLSNQPITQRISLEKGSHAMVLGQQLWISTGPVAQRSSKDYIAGKGPRIRIFNPFADDKPFNATSKVITISPDKADGVGAVTGGTTIPTQPDVVYLSHDSGHMSIWSRQTYECISVYKLGPHGITAIAGVIKYLWAANRAGKIGVFDTSVTPWRVLKVWPAHKEAVTAIRVDEHGIEKAGLLQVASAGLDQTVHLWDGTLSNDWLKVEQSMREAEFCTYRAIKTLHVTFNIDAANPIDLETSAENVELIPNILKNAMRIGGDPAQGGVDADRPPDIIVFGFQEVIDLENKKLTAKSLLLGSSKKKANDLGDRVSHQYRAWYDKLTSLVRLAMPPSCGYLLIQSESLVGLFTCVFVKQTEFRHVRETAISTVKTGLGGRYGNKGAVIARMVFDDTSICLTNCHLAAGQQHVKQRNADVADILESADVFGDQYADPAGYVGGGDGSMILDHELCFLSGDLNYRIDLKREVVVSAILSDRIGPLIEQDQLRKELKGNPSFRLRTFSEAPVTFVPTYKYDRGTHEWDTSEKRRIPAWCDRILWRSHHPDRIRCLEYRRWEATISDHRPVTAIFEAKVKAIDHKKAEKVEEELKEKWNALEQEILQNAVAFYSNPI